MTGQYKSTDDFEEGDFRKWAPRFNEEVGPVSSDPRLSALVLILDSAGSYLLELSQEPRHCS